jgi:hypothetical protein
MIRRFGGYFLIMLVVLDLVLIATHIFYLLKADDLEYMYSNLKDLFRINKDRGYPEAYQYAKFFWAGLLCLLLSFRRGHAGFALLTALFAWLLADDMMGLHEAAGTAFSEQISLPPLLGLTGYEYGQLVYAAGAAAVALVLFGLAFVFVQRQFQRDLWTVAGTVALLGFCGVFLDLLQGAFSKYDQSLRAVLIVFEDGGGKCCRLA